MNENLETYEEIVESAIEIFKDQGAYLHDVLDLIKNTRLAERKKCAKKIRWFGDGAESDLVKEVIEHIAKGVEKDL